MDIQQQVLNLKKDIIQMRRDFHKYPETGWVEYRTASIVADHLTKLGFTVYVGENACLTTSRMGVPSPEVLAFHESRALKEGVQTHWIEKMKGGHTAVVGVLKLNKPGPVIALRFDMDSNDLSESADSCHRPDQDGFASVHKNMMHACGHDGHTAIGLGVAKILIKNQHVLGGEIRLLFQPAEEGARGAKSMVDAGWLDGVDYFFSGHIGFKSRKIGEVVASVGGFLSTSKLDVSYFGHAAHAGEAPQEGKNALLAAAAAALHLHSISRHGEGATRINVGTLTAGTGRNVIANQAHLKLETRGETNELNIYMKTEAIRIIEYIAKVYDVTCEWEIVGEGISVSSNQELIPMIQQVAEKINTIHFFVPYKDLGGSEDASYMMQHVQDQGGKASYLLFGSALKAGHHQDLFDFDEDVMPIAIELLSRMVIKCQNE